MHKFAYKNQQLIPQTQAKISINERGYLFGDGIFETCYVHNATIYDFNSHLKRLHFGLKSLKITFDSTNLEEKCYELIEKNNLHHGIIKIQISRGEGNVGYAPKAETTPLLIITTKDLPSHPSSMSLGISSYKAPAQYLGKTTNALNYILTKIEASENNHFDAIITNHNDDICETSSANLFWVKNQEIFTPKQSPHMVLGTKRQKLLDISPFKITEITAKVTELESADEIFLTNSSFLLKPATHFQNRALKRDISDKLLTIFHEDLEKSCTKNA